MKAFFAVLVLFGVTVRARSNPPSELKEYYDQCKSEIGLTEEVGERPNVDDPKVKCFRACMLKKMGEMVDGKMELEKGLDSLMKHFSGTDDAMKEKITDCVYKANEETNECEVAATMYKCAKENIGELSN